MGMGVAVLQLYPGQDNKTGPQIIETLTRRIVNLGASQAGHFLVDCEVHQSVAPGPSPGPQQPPGSGQAASKNLSLSLFIFPSLCLFISFSVSLSVSLYISLFLSLSF